MCAAQELLGLVSPFASPSRAPPLAAIGAVKVTAERTGSRGMLGVAPSMPVKIVPRVRFYGQYPLELLPWSGALSAWHHT